MAGEQLRVTEGTELGKRLSVEQELLIGRAAQSDEGKLGDDPEISRRHARVSRGPDGRLTVEDLGSANGTYVNGERIDSPRMLAPGDVVRLGKTVLQVTEGAAAPEQARVQTRASAGPAFELMITAGGALGRRVTVGSELVLGRAVSGDGRLSEDPELSRRHARLARDAAGQLTIEDLGSANGTFLNDERVVGRQVLKPGDSVRVGSTTLRLTEVAGAAAQPASPVPSVPPAPSVAPTPERRAPEPRVHVPQRRPRPSTAEHQRLISALPPGTVFAGCRVEEVIGHGDMGVVYRADELALQRPVALKLILPDHSRDERFRERFRRESKIAAAIDHPNVIPVFDAGDEDGVLYITMRLVEGTDLRELIDAEGRVEPMRAARIVRHVGAALDAAHARGMVHRDVKPSNVLLGRDDHVYLSDFGLAKRSTSAQGLTRQGSIVARAEYVAPELILDQHVDARADVYALGCLLFESLTGDAPFAGWTEGPQALAHLEAPRPSPTDFRPDLPPEFDDVVRRAMATSPDERYPSAGDLGEAALVAAGGLRRARAWSMVATGEAAPVTDGRPPEPAPEEPQRPESAVGTARQADRLRWAIALAALALVAVGMVAALNGISTL